MLNKIKSYYNWGGRFLTNQYHIDAGNISAKELEKRPLRSDVINYLLSLSGNRQTNYLEIGVRNPDHNFNLINATRKMSVDPGVEFKENPVDFNMTSDEFFVKWESGEIIDKQIKFDVIFVDGLHLAAQAERDIANSLRLISDNGFVIIHDCNPPTEWHAREEYGYDISPAMNFWNGTTWKAFYKFRLQDDLTSACINTDWGIGIVTKQKLFNSIKINTNPFFEFKELSKNRVRDLNLISFEELVRLTKK